MKAQVAMEYIVTYGWALLAVMVLVAGLSFFGIFRPEDSLPERCIIVPNIECQDHQITVVEQVGPDTETLKLYVRNLNRQDLFVSKVQCELGSLHNETLSDAFDPQDYDASGPTPQGILRTNRYTNITCSGSTDDADALIKGSKVSAKVILEVYTVNSFPQQIEGEIVANVR